MDLGSYLDMQVIIPELHVQKEVANFLDKKIDRIDELIEKLGGVPSGGEKKQKKSLANLLLEYRSALIVLSVTGQAERPL